MKAGLLKPKLSEVMWHFLKSLHNLKSSPLQVDVSSQCIYTCKHTVYKCSKWKHWNNKKVDRDTLNIAVSYYWKASRCKTGVLWSLNLTQTCGSQSVVRICCENARLEHKKKEKYCSLNSLLVHWSFAGYDLQARLIARKKNLAEFSRH